MVMFQIKSRCLGASMISERQREMLMLLVLPKSLLLELVHDSAVLEGGPPSCIGIGIKLMYE